jgi:enoyl-[acyl-carrier protein] reductase II
MFEGDLDEGELEIGQVSTLFNAIKPAGEIVQEVWNECLQSAAEMQNRFLKS